MFPLADDPPAWGAVEGDEALELEHAVANNAKTEIRTVHFQCLMSSSGHR
jgi:hypothetical protein